MNRREFLLTTIATVAGGAALGARDWEMLPGTKVVVFWFYRGRIHKKITTPSFAVSTFLRLLPIYNWSRVIMDIAVHPSIVYGLTASCARLGQVGEMVRGLLFNTMPDTTYVLDLTQPRCVIVTATGMHPDQIQKATDIPSALTKVYPISVDEHSTPAREHSIETARLCIAEKLV